MLIDDSYFISELNIPNTDTLAVQENLGVFIKKYEPKILTMLLGRVMYSEYLAGILADPIDPKWTALQDQLRNTDTKVSLIANYVYFFFVRDQTIYNSGTGMQQAEGENAKLADSKIKTVRAWNEMNELCFEVYKFLQINSSVYGFLPYSLYLRGDYSLWDWSYWWWQLLPSYRNCSPEIFVPINTLNW